jgi:outer membrane protein assembly factor BamB
VVNGKPQVIFPGGDCFLYSFEPDNGKLIWKFNCDPKREGKRKEEGRISNYIIATPVVHDNRVYVGLGVYPGGHPENTRFSYLVCADITKRGDVSPVDLDPKNPKNKNSALVWALGGENPNKKDERPVLFGSTISTCAVHDGLVYIAEERGYVYCLDAKTGQKHWEHDSLKEIWGSPYYADGKVYLGTSDGEILVYAHGKEHKLLATNNMDEQVHSTPVAVNGVLYVMTWSKLHAIAAGK